MAGTLTASIKTTSFRFLTGEHSFLAPSGIGSTSNVFTINNRNVPKASMHAVIDEPLVESKKMKPTSLYDVLNVKQNASQSEIKSAYRSLAKRYHPDVSGSKQKDNECARDFIDIHDAYVTLCDPTKRETYDLKMSTGLGRRSGLYTGARKGYARYVGRRWETDQCW